MRTPTYRDQFRPSRRRRCRGRRSRCPCKAVARCAPQARPAETAASPGIAAAKRGRVARAMDEPVTGHARIIRQLNEFTSSTRQLTRIRATLWREAGLGDSWWVPKDWNPDPAWMAVVDLRKVRGLGRTSREVIGRWLEGNGIHPATSGARRRASAGHLSDRGRGWDTCENY